MITRFRQSWQLFKASITVTLRSRKLLWFPVLTTCLTAFIAVFFLSAMALPVVLHHTGYRLDQKEHWVALKDYYLPAHPVQPEARNSAGTASEALRLLLTGRSMAADKAGQPAPATGFPWASLVLLVIYFVSMFLATFFNVAFYSEIICALNGRGVSFRRGLRTARSRLPSILTWSLLAGLVGWIIRTLEQRLPFAARVVTGLIGITWSVAAVFAIPVIIQEQPLRNPLKILQQSARTLKRTWGEGLIGYLGFSTGNMVMFACSLVPLLLAMVIARLIHSTWLGVVAGAIWLLALLFMAYVSRVASHVYRCALYLYAAEGVVPGPYSQELFDMAWKVRSGPEKR